MTRINPTLEEVLLETKMLDHLRKRGFEVEVVPRKSKDKPDLAFVVDGKVVACECVQIPPSRIFRWMHKRIAATTPDQPYCHAVVWAEEPHSWVRDAISKKNSKLRSYKVAIGADLTWLLIHTPIADTQTFVRGDFSWKSQMLRYGACSEKNDFDEILSWEPISGIQSIFRPCQITPKFTIDFSLGYPSRNFVQFGGLPFTTTREGEPEVIFEYAPIEPIVIQIPPIDPEYKQHTFKFRRRRYVVKIIAGATEARSQVEIVWLD